MSSIAANLARVRERIAAAARRAGRNPEEVKLVGVSKTVDLDRIREAVAAGLQALGENYVQEARDKIPALQGEVEWHLIGHLQTNKAKYAARLFDCIHTVDSLKLAQELDRRARNLNRHLPVLIQVNLAGEESKSGISPDKAPELAAQVAQLPNLQVKGLMTMPPFFSDPERARPFFRRLRLLADQIRQLRLPGVSMAELSMGMSGDFEVAIEEGATLVRVGTAIFGQRP